MGESGRMFGNYKRSLDDKNRVMIPIKLRDPLGEILYITLGPDNVLEVRSKEEFDIWKNKLLNINSLNKNARTFARIILGNTEEVVVDKQFRINIPEIFKLKTNITKEITFVGVGDKAELWDPQKFNDFQNQFKDDALDGLASKLLKEGAEL